MKKTPFGFMGFFEELGKLILFYVEITKTFMVSKGNREAITANVASVAYRSMSTVIFAGVFVGAILVMQFSEMLKEYDAMTMLGGLNTSACVREVAPLIISFLLAGKVGAYTAAELGTMRVTEQIDAVRCLGTDPMQYIVLPRFLGIVFSSLLLLMIGLFVSVVGGMLVANLVIGVNPLQFLVSIPKFTTMTSLGAGLFKSFIYGNIVAGVACYQGYNASGGARGVGRAVTMAAVYTNFYIVLANYVTSNFLDFANRMSEQLSGFVGMN